MTDVMITPTNFRTQVSQAAGSNQRVLLNDYQKLREEGLAIQLDISGTGIFTTALDWAELGVGIDSTRAKWFTRGRKYLFPKENVAALSNVVSKMRQAYSSMTRDIAVLRPWRYLHYKMYREWSATWQGLTVQLAEVVEDMIANYTTAVDTLAAEYNAICAEAWNAITATGTGDDFITFKGRPYNDQDEFTDAVVSAVLAKIPSPERIREEIKAVYHTAVIQGIEDIAREEARAAQLRAQAEVAKLESSKMEQELSHQQRMYQLEEDGKREQIELMLHAEAERIRSEMDTIASPLEETFVQLRQYMAETASEMIRTIQAGGGKIHGRTARKALETLSELFEMRTIVDDEKLRTRLEELKAAIGPVGESKDKSSPERDSQSVVKALEQIQSLVESAREDFTAEPSRFALLEVDL